MLIAIGPDVQNAQDYTMHIGAGTVDIHSYQGDTLDTFKCVVHDPQSAFTISPEDDIFAIDETDSGGWPTVNLLLNPNFETFSSGQANNWNVNGTGTNISLIQDTTNVLYGSNAQKFVFTNANSGINYFFYQDVTLPTDENNTLISAFPYYFSIYNHTGVAATNVTCKVYIAWYTKVGGTLISTTAQQTVNLTTTTGWTRTVASGVAPSNATVGRCIVLFSTSSATNSVTVTFDGAQMEYATFTNVLLPSGVTAGAAGKYPTPFCAVGQLRCYLDSATGLYFRQKRLFGGYVRETILDYAVGPERFIEVDAVDYSVMLAEAPVTLVVRQQPDNTAILNICNYAKNQGFLIGMDYTSFVTNIITVDAMVFNWQTVKDAISKIANMSQAAYWVDYYKALHYGPALATTTAFGVSWQPNSSATPPTYPMYQLSIDSDSTQTMNSPVYEGSTQISAPQTFTGYGIATTTTQNITNGANVTSIAVSAIAQAIPAESLVTLTSGANTQTFAVSQNIAAGATSIHVVAQNATNFYGTGSTLTVTAFILNDGSEVAQIDSFGVTVSGTTTPFTIGLYSVNQYSDGYNVLLDPQTGLAYCNPTIGPYSGTSIPPNNATITVTYRFLFPVLIRLTKPTPPGHKKRKIHNKTTDQTINSKQSAIDRANADLNQYQKARPIGTLTIMSPPVPLNYDTFPGSAIYITHQPAFGTNSPQLYQIQECELTVLGGNGTQSIVQRVLKLGFYRPDFVIKMHHTQKAAQQNASSAPNDQILSDVLSVAESVIFTDNITATVSNEATWGPTTSSTWNGTFCWG